jgi:hypothetical protein
MRSVAVVGPSFSSLLLSSRRSQCDLIALGQLYKTVGDSRETLFATWLLPATCHPSNHCQGMATTANAPPAERFGRPGVMMKPCEFW